MHPVNSRHLLIKRDIYPLLKLALPLVLTGLVGSAVSFIETLFLAHLNQQTLAAGALVSGLYVTFAVILFGILSAINILVAYKHGADDKQSISFILRDGVLLAILLTIPAFILFWNISPLFLLLGQQPSIPLLAQAYLRALAWGLLPNFVAVALFEFVIGLGHTRIVLVITILGVSLTTLFSYVLIFGKWGFPALGIAGAGWGMSLSYWITAVVLIVHLLRHQAYRPYIPSILNKQRPSYLWELLQIGLPMGTMYCLEVAFFFAAALIMGSLSEQLLAANQIAMQYMCALMGVIFAIAQAITVRMGHLLGAREGYLASNAAYAGMMLAAIFMGFIALLYWGVPDLLIAVDFDVQDPENAAIVALIKRFLAICAIFQIFEAVRIALFGALRALKDTRFTLLASALSYWGIALPLGYVLATYFQLSGDGLWWGMVMGAGFSAALLFWRFRLKMSRQLKVGLVIG